MTESAKPGMRRIAVAVAVVVIVLGAAALVWQLVKPNSRPNELERITIAQAGDFFLYAPLYIAVDGGFFEEHDLDVRLVSTGGDDKTWAAVMSGDASFGVADPTFIAVSASRGEPGRVIASIVNGVPFWGVTFKPEVPAVQSPAQLQGFEVATFSSPSTAYTLQRRMFMDAGLEPAIREGAFGSILAMLRAGTADIGLELEPNVSTAVAEGARVVYSLGEVYGDFAITGLTATPELLDRNPGLAQRVVCSLQQALDYARDKPEEALAILTARFPEVPADVAQTAFARVVRDGIVPTTVVTSQEAWTKAVALRREVGDLPESVDTASLVENRFAEWAQQHCRGEN